MGIVSAPARALLLWLSARDTPRRLASTFGPARRVARRFVAGESAADALAAVSRLKDDGLRATVAFLGEHVTDPAEVRAASFAIRTFQHELAGAGLEPNVSIKLTQLGLLVDPALAEAELRRILDVAEAVGGFVRIDMEGSAVLPATLDLFERATSDGAYRGRAGVVIQAYLRRSEEDIRRLIARGAPVRLVKGAYAEPAAIAFPSRADVDAAYVRLAGLLLADGARAAGVYPAFATHDGRMIAAVLRLARERGIPSDAYEFQMLLGVRRELQVRLVESGRRVRVYVPFGEQWYPYLMRRLAERPANLAFFLRQLVPGRH